MKQIFIMHGFRGEPNGGWKPWLMWKLDQFDVWAFSLRMPNPSAPQQKEWVDKISQEVGSPSTDTFLVGHSLGVVAILRYLESLPSAAKVGACFLISGPAGKLEVENLGSKIRAIDNFFESDFDFTKIKGTCDKFFIIHGDNDTKVPFPNAQKLQESLGAELTVVQGGKHLSNGDGIRELPELLDLILKVL